MRPSKASSRRGVSSSSRRSSSTASCGARLISSGAVSTEPGPGPALASRLVRGQQLLSDPQGIPSVSGEFLCRLGV